jgi:lipopolysaccharide/colanic/teichoic acid biosynthesis glycosyltransferase
MSDTSSTTKQSPVAKRVLDVAGAAMLLALTGPVLAMAALAIRLRMGSPMLYRQARTGLHGEIFTLLKLRTMAPDHEAHPKPESDTARLTTLGRWLRGLSIDELPQLWNVFRGDMSLVGPRPLLPEYLERYSLAHARRHEVLPGLTGLAQVSGRNALTWEEKFGLDVHYVDHRSLALDLRILWRTLVAVISRRGIGAPGHATMPEFLGNEEGPCATS